MTTPEIKIEQEIREFLKGESTLSIKQLQTNIVGLKIWAARELCSKLFEEITVEERNVLFEIFQTYIEPKENADETESPKINLCWFLDSSVHPEIRASFIDHYLKTFPEDLDFYNNFIYMGPPIDIISMCESLKIVLHNCTEEEKQKIVSRLLDSAIKNSSSSDFPMKVSSLVITDFLNTNAQPYLEASLKNLSKDNLEQHKKNIQLCQNSNPHFLYKRVNEFAHGIGPLSYEGGLLTATAIHNKKLTDRKIPYTFNPTILKEDEFSKFLEAIQNSSLRPIKEHFVLTGAHWLSGRIEIDKDGNVKILLIDSLGLEKPNYALNSAIREFNEIFTSGEIYIDDMHRQGNDASCAIYALDDVRHLYTIERYMQTKYKDKGGLFGYLHANKTGLKEGESNVYISPLPLPFMRTKVGRKLLEKVIPGRSEEEQSLIVNTHGQTAIESAKAGFEYDEYEEKPVNRRLLSKFKQFGAYNYDYLSSHSEDQTKENMEKFNLSSLEQRLASPTARQEHRLRAKVEEGVKQRLDEQLETVAEKQPISIDTQKQLVIKELKERLEKDKSKQTKNLPPEDEKRGKKSPSL